MAKGKKSKKARRKEQEKACDGEEEIRQENVEESCQEICQKVEEIGQEISQEIREEIRQEVQGGGAEEIGQEGQRQESRCQEGGCRGGCQAGCAQSLRPQLRRRSPRAAPKPAAPQACASPGAELGRLQAHCRAESALRRIRAVMGTFGRPQFGPSSDGDDDTLAERDRALPRIEFEAAALVAAAFFVLRYRCGRREFRLRRGGSIWPVRRQATERLVPAMAAGRAPTGS